MSRQDSSFAAGWYPSFDNPGIVQYWDGRRWTEWRQPAVPAPNTVGAGFGPALPPGPTAYGPASPVGPQKTARTLGVISICINPFLILSILTIIFASVALSRQAAVKSAGQPVQEFGTGTLWLGIIVTVLYALVWAWLTSRY